MIELQRDRDFNIVTPTIKLPPADPAQVAGEIAGAVDVSDDPAVATFIAAQKKSVALKAEREKLAAQLSRLETDKAVAVDNGDAGKALELTAKVREVAEQVAVYDAVLSKHDAAPLRAKARRAVMEAVGAERKRALVKADAEIAKVHGKIERDVGDSLRQLVETVAVRNLLQAGSMTPDQPALDAIATDMILQRIG